MGYYWQQLLSKITQQSAIFGRYVNIFTKKNTTFVRMYLGTFAGA